MRYARMSSPVPVKVIERGMCADVEVRASPIEGLGVFATRRFEAGETILTIDDSHVVVGVGGFAPGEDRYCDYLAGGRMVLMMAPERHINHSCRPNVFVKTTGGRRRVVAMREIAAGEELGYNYTINGSGETVWDCACGAARCRERVHSDFFHLPIQLQWEYLPFVDEWFLRERAEEFEVLKGR